MNGFDGNGTLLNAKSYKELFTEQLGKEHFPPISNKNEGIFMSFSPDGLIGHSGGDPGVTTYMFFNPKTETGKLLLVNTDLDSDGKKAYESILKILEKYQKFKWN